MKVSSSRSETRVLSRDQAISRLPSKADLVTWRISPLRHFGQGSMDVSDEVRWLLEANIKPH